MCSWQCSIVGLWGWTVLCCVCCAVLWCGVHKVPLLGSSPNSTLPPCTTIASRHDTPTRLHSTDPLSVAEREGARSLAAFSRDCAAIRFNCRSIARAPRPRVEGDEVVRRSRAQSSTHTEGGPSLEQWGELRRFRTTSWPKTSSFPK